jgi:hypothetical protein
MCLKCYRYRLLPIALGFSLMSSLAWAALPVPQDTIAPSEYDTDDFLAGFYPTLNLAYTSSSNPRRVGGDEVSDTAWVISPSLRYHQPLGRRQRLTVDYGGNYTYYSDLSEENSQDHRLGANLFLDLSSRFDLNLGADYARGHDTRGLSDSRLTDLADDELDRWRSTGFHAEGIFGRAAAKGQIRFGYAHNRLRFTNNDQSTRDRDSDTLNLAFFYNYSPKTKLFVEGRLSQIEYIEAEQAGLDLSSQETSLSAGATWQATARTQGHIQVGFTRKEPDAAGAESFDGLTFSGRVVWARTSYSKIGLFYTRSLEEPTELDASYIVANTYGADWNHSFTERLGMTLWARAGVNEFSNDRQDDLTDWGLRLGYQAADWLAFGAGYSQLKRESNTPDGDFSDSVLQLTLEIRGAAEASQSTRNEAETTP